MARLGLWLGLRRRARNMDAPFPSQGEPSKVRRVRECLLRNHFSGAVARPNALPFSTRATGVFWQPREQAACPGKTPVSGVWAGRIGSLEPRFTVGAIAGSPAVADARPPWILSHLAFQGAGRLHVNVGWRHPRPVAANDAHIVSGSFAPPGIAPAVQILRRLPTSLTRRKRA